MTHPILSTSSLTARIAYAKEKVEKKTNKAKMELSSRGKKAADEDDKG